MLGRIRIIAGLLLTLAPSIAAEDILVEFDYVNSFKGYTTTVSINSNGTVSLVTVRRYGEKSSSVMKLSREQMTQVQALLNSIDTNSIMPKYGFGLRATDQPTYRFRFPHGGEWSETSIYPNLTLPKASPQLVTLLDFMMQLVNSGFVSQ